MQRGWHFIDPIESMGLTCSRVELSESQVYFEASYPTTVQLFYRKSRSSKCIINIEMQCFMICKYAVINVSLAVSCRFQCEYLGTIFRQTLTAFVYARRLLLGYFHKSLFINLGLQDRRNGI